MVCLLFACLRLFARDCCCVFVSFLASCRLLSFHSLLLLFLFDWLNLSFLFVVRFRCSVYVCFSCLMCFFLVVVFVFRVCLRGLRFFVFVYVCVCSRLWSCLFVFGVVDCAFFVFGVCVLFCYVCVVVCCSCLCVALFFFCYCVCLCVFACPFVCLLFVFMHCL